jgi:hypothetical protein
MGKRIDLIIRRIASHSFILLSDLTPLSTHYEACRDQNRDLLNDVSYQTLKSRLLFTGLYSSPKSSTVRWMLEEWEVGRSGRVLLLHLHGS